MKTKLSSNCTTFPFYHTSVSQADELELIPLSVKQLHVLRLLPSLSEGSVDSMDHCLLLPNRIRERPFFFVETAKETLQTI